MGEEKKESIWNIVIPMAVTALATYGYFRYKDNIRDAFADILPERLKGFFGYKKLEAQSKGENAYTFRDFIAVLYEAKDFDFADFLAYVKDRKYREQNK